jgi:hypothetical protein
MSDFTELLDNYMAAKMNSCPGQYNYDFAKQLLDARVSDIEAKGVQSDALLRGIKDYFMNLQV